MTELTASAAKSDAARIGALAGLAAGPVFLASVGLNTWASLDYLHGLGWEFIGGEEVPPGRARSRVGRTPGSRSRPLPSRDCWSYSSPSPCAASCRAGVRDPSRRRCCAPSEQR